MDTFQERPLIELAIKASISIEEHLKIVKNILIKFNNNFVIKVDYSSNIIFVGFSSTLLAIDFLFESRHVSRFTEIRLYVTYETKENCLFLTQRYILEKEDELLHLISNLHKIDSLLQ